MNIQINTVEQCKKVLARLKEKEYVLFGFGGDYYDEGFEIKYINKKSKVIRFRTFDKDVQTYFLKYGAWRLI